MASIINAATSGGLVTTADTSGILQLQTAGTTAVTVDASQNVTFVGSQTLSGGTANGVTYLNGSKVLTSGSALTFDGSNFASTGNITSGGTLQALGTVQSSSGADLSLNANGANRDVIVKVNGTEQARFVGSTSVLSIISGIKFPATQSASSDANTLDDYEEGSFTFTGTGFTTTPTDTAYYTKIGNQVTVQLPDITGTSNTTLMTITGLPVALRANQAYVSFLLVYNASVSYTGHIYGGHDNTVQVFWDAGESAFTASGVKGITNNVNFTYTLA